MALKVKFTSPITIEWVTTSWCARNSCWKRYSLFLQLWLVITSG